MGRGNWVLPVLLLSAGIAAITAYAVQPHDSAAAHCQAFASGELEQVSIDASQAVTGHAELPDHCSIRGTIAPSIGFEARFPLRDWNGKYYQSGCGGYCGSVLPDKPGFSNTINQALLRGYAAITTDAGHRGGLGDASWANNNPQAVELYADRAIPLTYQAGVQMVNAYYGQNPELEYFGGCSNGGRMAAMAAQRYPELFDGILGGAAVLNLSQNGGIYGSWVVQANTGADGKRVLRRDNFAAKLPVLAREVLAQCDAADGHTDGVISAPRRCTVKVDLLPQCTGDSASDCFTSQEREVLKKWYQGPRNSAGEALYPGMPPGSEDYWLVWFLDGENAVAPGNALGGDYARYLGFAEPVDTGYSALDFDFDHDPQRLVANGLRLNAMDPDLSAFRAAGGKFLMWHGWQDPLVLPDQSVAYYEDVLSTLGGQRNVDPFFRLFMIPGYGHCWELPSRLPDQFNPIAILENWVEQGQAPDVLTVTKTDSGESSEIRVCPYPASPVYLSGQQQPHVAHCGK